MTFPTEVYEQILLSLPLRDLLSAACVSSLFYKITRWCLAKDEYISRWTLSFRENNGNTRVIPLDLEQTKASLNSTGMYVFMAEISAITWCHEILYFESAHADVRAIPFVLRFLDFDDPPDFNGEK